jgi:cytochrome-b5 reductase
MTYTARLLMTEFVTHDVRRLLISRPEGLEWEPGQGVEVAIDEDGLRGATRPFTPTSLPRDRLLELTVKRYPARDGVTCGLHALAPGAPLLIGDPFGAIRYRGPGTFIAAGTGITPFLAILRALALDDRLSGHRLLLSNRSEHDVICRDELSHYLGERCILTFTRGHEPAHQGRHIDAGFLDANIGDRKGQFYVCGPPGFVERVNMNLLSIGVHPRQLVYER